AGFGKTTLSATWAQCHQIPAAWLTLQPSDRPRERFLFYLIQALQSISPHIGQTTLALTRGGSPAGMLYALVNDLAEVESDFALVLDDYHSIDCPETAELLQFLLENRPATFHLLITTRVIPALNLARLRAQGEVTEITASDLRFTPSEIHTFLEASMSMQLSDEDLDHLDRSTEGWAVGLQLAALSLRRQPADWQAFAGQEHIFDYLAEEVLRREAPDVQEFLKVSALFDRFCAPLWAAITNPGQEQSESDEQSRRLIEYVDRANLFLVPLDSTGTWFRYHVLFTDFLRRQMPDQQALPLYRLASHWFEQNGLLDDAIHYATHASDHERAAALLEDHYIDILQRGEHTALAEWISAMPVEVLEKHPPLWLARGWISIISLDSDEARHCLEKAEALISLDSTGDRLRGEVKSLRILTGIFAGDSVAPDEITSTLGLLSDKDDLLHTLLHFNLGLNHVMRGETAHAVEALTETLRLTQALNNPLVTIVAQVQLGETRQMRGAFGLAERTFQQAIRDAKESLGDHTFLLGMPYISYADLLREQNRFDEAIDYAEKGIAYCLVWQPVASLDGQIALARLLFAQGKQEEAFARLEYAIQMASGSATILDDVFVAIHMIRLMLLQGSHARAVQTLKGYDLEKASAQMYYHLWELTQLVLFRARILEISGEPSHAVDTVDALSSLIAEMETRERVTSLIEALILRAYAHDHAGQRPAAAEDLSRALVLGAQSGYIRIFADEGKRLLDLLDRCRTQIHAPRSYLDLILSTLHQESARPAPPPYPVPEGLAPLTRRELDILSLLASGKSNQEIAVERVLAVSTVKKHVANILSKLGVANRTQAVMLAKKLGWLDE
ncbi:MAG: hypothetical protein EHM70_14835, partial [Chloroflexota bacterium]